MPSQPHARLLNKGAGRLYPADGPGPRAEGCSERMGLRRLVTIDEVHGVGSRPATAMTGAREPPCMRRRCAYCRERRPASLLGDYRGTAAGGSEGRRDAWSLRLPKRRNDEVDHDDGSGHLWRRGSLVKLIPECRANDTRVVVVGTKMQVACRDGNQDRECSDRGDQDKSRKQKPLAFGGQAKHGHAAMSGNRRGGASYISVRTNLVRCRDLSMRRACRQAQWSYPGMPG